MSFRIPYIGCWVRGWIDQICAYLDRRMIQSPCFRGKAVYGPVSTRSFGQVLGLNLMKCKVCSYDCVYCQAGQTECRSTCRESCIGVHELFCVVRKKLELLQAQGITVEAMAFMPQGEPTLDDELSQKIRILRPFGLPIVVVTNGSLLGKEMIREDLRFADQVSIKVDSVVEETWLKLNRPHTRLDFERMLDGIATFASVFHGRLITETMLVKGYNDTPEEIEALARFLASFPCEASVFTIPHRPPSKAGVHSPDDETRTLLLEQIQASIPKAEIAFEAKDDVFHGAGEPRDEVLAMLSAQPMTETSVMAFSLERTGNTELPETLLDEGCVLRVLHEGRAFLMLAPTPA